MQLPSFVGGAVSFCKFSSCQRIEIWKERACGLICRPGCLQFIHQLVPAQAAVDPVIWVAKHPISAWFCYDQFFSLKKSKCFGLYLWISQELIWKWFNFYNCLLVPVVAWHGPTIFLSYCPCVPKLPALSTLWPVYQIFGLCYTINYKMMQKKNRFNESQFIF